MIRAGGFDGLRVAAAPICAPDESVSETPGKPKMVHAEVPPLVKSRTVKSVPAAAPPPPSVMRRLDVEQDGALAGALLLEALLEAGALAALARVLAAATLDCWPAGWPAELELCEPQPAARITAMAAIALVSEFRAVRALIGMRAIPSVKSSDSHARITTAKTRYPASCLGNFRRWQPKLNPVSVGPCGSQHALASVRRISAAGPVAAC